MLLKTDKTSLLIRVQGLELVLNLLIRSNSPEYFVIRGVFVHISFHVELGQVVFHNLMWIVSFELDVNLFDIFQSRSLHFGVTEIQ